MGNNWKHEWSSLLTYIIFVVHMCKTQSLTTCENNVLINVEASDTNGSIYSYGYPDNYAYTSFGDCRILITTTGSKIRINIDDYNKRTNEKTLNIFDGTSIYSRLLAGETDISKGKSFLSTGKSLYLSHWSYGFQNNAFIISYHSVDPDNDEEGNLSWIAAPIIVNLVWILFVCLYCWHKVKTRGTNNPQTEQQLTNTTNDAEQVTSDVSATQTTSTSQNLNDDTPSPEAQNGQSLPLSQPTSSPVQPSTPSTLQPPPPFPYSDPPPPYSESHNYPVNNVDKCVSNV